MGQYEVYKFLKKISKTTQDCYLSAKEIAEMLDTTRESVMDALRFMQKRWRILDVQIQGRTKYFRLIGTLRKYEEELNKKI
jgi:hypothetical protein